MRRRDFLAMGAAALPLLPRAPRPWPLFRGTLDKIGIQLYTVRKELVRDVEGTLARLAAMGYQEVEFAGYPQGTARSLRAILDRLGLKAVSSHVNLTALRGDWDRTLDEAVALGQRYIVVASVPGADRRTLDDWRRTSGLLNRGAEAAKAKGIQLAYHNHEFEFGRLDGQVPYDLVLAETDRKLVQFEMDLYWITRGGGDPLAYFAKWPGRFPMLHVKDMDGTPARGFADLGRGTIDFGRVFARAKQAGVRHYFYEQDTTPGSPFDSAKVGYDYLRNLAW